VGEQIVSLTEQSYTIPTGDFKIFPRLGLRVTAYLNLTLSMKEHNYLSEVQYVKSGYLASEGRETREQPENFEEVNHLRNSPSNK
jgi:hypothetical protein